MPIIASSVVITMMMTSMAVNAGIDGERQPQGRRRQNARNPPQAIITATEA
ncbi:hypothetical protein ACU686_23360 [Yinghuangia aomiensis]